MSMYVLYALSMEECELLHEVLIYRRLKLVLDKGAKQWARMRMECLVHM
jgi:hypothetical protein